MVGGGDVSSILLLGKEKVKKQVAQERKKTVDKWLRGLDSTSPCSRYANEPICIIILRANKGLMG